MPQRKSLYQETQDKRAQWAQEDAAQAAEFEALMNSLKAPAPKPITSVQRQAAIAPEETNWVDTAKKWAPTAVRGAGGFLGFTPVTGALGGGGTEIAAQGLEKMLGQREEFDLREMAAAAATGAVGGKLVKAIAPVFKQPLQAALRALPWAAAQPVVHAAVSGDEMPSLKDIGTSAAVGAGTAGALGGLGKLLGGKAPTVPTPKPPVPTAPGHLVDRLGAIKATKDIPSSPLPVVKPTPAEVAETIETSMSKGLDPKLAAGAKGLVKDLQSALAGAQKESAAVRAGRVREEGAFIRQEDAADLAQMKANERAETLRQKELDNLQNAIAIEEAKAGRTPSAPSITTSVSAKTPTGTERMSTTWKMPEVKEDAADVVEAVVTGKSKPVPSQNRAQPDLTPDVPQAPQSPLATTLGVRAGGLSKVAPEAPTAPLAAPLAPAVDRLSELEAKVASGNLSFQELAEYRALLRPGGAPTSGPKTFDAPGLDPNRITEVPGIPLKLSDIGYPQTSLLDRALAEALAPTERRSAAPGRFEGVERRAASPVMQQIAEMDVAQGAALRGTEADIAHMGPEALEAEMRRRAAREAWTPEPETPLSALRTSLEPGEVPVPLFGGRFEALSDVNPFGYKATQAAQKAGEIPADSIYYAHEASGKPITPARMQGKELFQRAPKNQAKAQVETQAPAVVPPGPPISAAPPIAAGPSTGTPPIPPTAQAGEAAPFDFAEALRKIDAAKGRPGGGLWNRLAGERGIGGNERGEVTPEVALSLATGATGALAGGALAGEDNRLEGAIAGGLVGAVGGPAAYRVLSQTLPKIAADPNLHPTAANVASAVATPVGMQEYAKNVINTLPEFIRFNLLASTNLINNAVTAPIGALIAKATELHMAGDPRGAAIFAAMTPENLAGHIKGSFDEATTLITHAEERAGGGGYASATTPMGRLFAAPGTYMTTGDVAARRIMMEAGLSEAEARAATLTSEPEFGFTKGLVNLARQGGVFGQTMLPFSKTIANIAEQGVMSTPGLGFISQAMREAPDPMKQQIARQALGGLYAGGGALAGYNMDEVDDPLAKKFLRSFASNVAGPYSGLAAAGMAGGAAYKAGKSGPQSVAAGIKGGLQNLPLPTTAIPASYIDTLAKAAEGDIGLDTIPSSAVPGLVREGLMLAGVDKPTKGKRQKKQKRQTRAERS